MILALVVAVAAVYDLRFRRIPNWLTGLGWVAGIGLGAYVRGWPGLQDALLGSLLGFGVYAGLFALRAMGGGDVKLMAAVGAFTGPREWFVVFVLASLIGGAIALVAVLTKGELVRVARNIATVVWELAHLRLPHVANPELDVANDKARTLPHGVSIAIASLLWTVARN